MKSMKQLPLSIALATGALFLAACGDTGPGADSPANPLLRYVPADTPFVMANLEPVPADVVDVHLQRMAPMLDQFQAALDGLQEELQSGEADVHDAETQAVMEAVLAEFDGKLNREGLESLGFSLEKVSVMYGHGLFPVARLGLGDPVKVRAMLDRVQANSGVSMPEQSFQGVNYWRASDANGAMTLHVSILDDHVAFAATPTGREAEFLPTFLGFDLPARSIADSGALVTLNEEKDFAPYGSGYADLNRVADELLEADSLTATWMSGMGHFDPAQVDPACALEARLITAFVPRLVIGTTEVTADAVAIRYQVETNAWLGGQLARLVSDVPPASSDPTRMATFSMSLEMGRVASFLRESANAMAQRPFECPQLQDLNQQVQQLAESLNQPLPPFIGNLKGARAALSDIDPANPSPETVRGHFALEMESPQMVVGMASMMVPGFEELQIEPGGDPVELPQEIMTVQTPEFEAYAVMSKDAIGISLGKGEKDGLRAFLDESGDPDGVFLSAEYDARMLSRLQRESNAAYMAAAADTEGQGGMDLEAMAESYETLLGRTRFELRFSEDGLTIDNRQTFTD